MLENVDFLVPNFNVYNKVKFFPACTENKGHYVYLALFQKVVQVGYTSTYYKIQKVAKGF